MVPTEEMGFSNGQDEAFLNYTKTRSSNVNSNNHDHSNNQYNEGESSVGEAMMKYGSCNESGEMLARELLARELQARELLSREMGSQNESQDHRRRRSKSRRATMMTMLSGRPYNNIMDSCNISLDGSTMSRSRWEADPSETFQHESASLPAEFLYFKFEQIVARWAEQKTASVMSLERRRPKLMNRPPRIISTIIGAIPEDRRFPRFMRNTLSRSIQLEEERDATISSSSATSTSHTPSVNTSQQRARKLNRGQPMTIQTAEETATIPVPPPIPLSSTPTRRKASPSPLRKNTISTPDRRRPQQRTTPTLPPSRPTATKRTPTRPTTWRSTTTKRNPSPSPARTRNLSPSPARTSTVRRQTPTRRAGGAPPLRSSTPLKSKESPVQKRRTPINTKTPLASNRKKNTINTNARQVETRSPIESTEQNDAAHYIRRESPVSDGSIISPRSRLQQGTPTPRPQTPFKPDPDGPSPNSRPDPEGDRWPTPQRQRQVRSPSPNNNRSSFLANRTPSPAPRPASPALRFPSPQKVPSTPTTAPTTATTTVTSHGIDHGSATLSGPKANTQQVAIQHLNQQQQRSQTPTQVSIRNATTPRATQQRGASPSKAPRVASLTKTPHQSTARRGTPPKTSVSPARTQRTPTKKLITPSRNTAPQTQASPRRAGTSSIPKSEQPKKKQTVRKPLSKPEPPPPTTRRRKSRLPPIPSFRNPPPPARPQPKKQSPNPAPPRKGPPPKGQQPASNTSKNSKTKGPGPSPRNGSTNTSSSPGSMGKTRSSTKPSDKTTPAPKTATRAQRDAPWRSSKNPDGKAPDPPHYMAPIKGRQDPPTPRPYPRRVGRMHKRAATLLQSFSRMVPIRRKFLRFVYAVVVLQSRQRRRFQMEKFMQALKGTKLQNFSCIVIQRNYRMYICRMSYIQLRNTVIVLQSATRMLSCRSSYIELRSACEHLLGRSTLCPQLTPISQVTVRGGRLRIYSALLIQSLVRMRWVRAAFLELKLSAQILQKWFRKVRIVIRAQNHAAFVLQRWAQMLSLRSCFLDLRKSAISMQSFARMANARLRYIALKQIQLEDKSATLIQSLYRGGACQSAYQQLRLSAIVLQGWVRVLIAYKEAQCQTITMRSAKVLQKWVRKMSQRKNERIMQSAMVLQKWARVVGERSAHEKVQQAAISLQCWARQMISERLVLRTICARLIQACFRGYRANKAFIEKRACASMIQAVVKGTIYRVRFLYLRLAVTNVQKIRRGKIARNRTSKLKERTEAAAALRAVEISLSETMDMAESSNSSKASAESHSPTRILIKRREAARERRKTDPDSTDTPEPSESTPEPSVTSLIPHDTSTDSIESSTISSSASGEPRKLKREETRDNLPTANVHSDQQTSVNPSSSPSVSNAPTTTSTRYSRPDFVDTNRTPSPTSVNKPSNTPTADKKRTPRYDDVVSAALAFVSQSPSQNSKKARELFVTSPTYARDQPLGKSKPAPKSSRIAQRFLQEISHSKVQGQISDQNPVSEPDQTQNQEYFRQGNHKMDTLSEDDSVDSPLRETRRRQPIPDHHRRNHKRALMATVESRRAPPELDATQTQQVTLLAHALNDDSIKGVKQPAEVLALEQRLTSRDPIGDNMSRQASRAKEEPPESPLVPEIEPEESPELPQSASKAFLLELPDRVREEPPASPTKNGMEQEPSTALSPSISKRALLDFPLQSGESEHETRPVYYRSSGQDAKLGQARRPTSPIPSKSHSTMPGIGTDSESRPMDRMNSMSFTHPQDSMSPFQASYNTLPRDPTDTETRRSADYMSSAQYSPPPGQLQYAPLDQPQHGSLGQPQAPMPAFPAPQASAEGIQFAFPGGQALPSNFVPAPADMLAKLPQAEVSSSQQALYFISGSQGNGSTGPPRLYALQPVSDLRSQHQLHEPQGCDVPDSHLGQQHKMQQSSPPTKEAVQSSMNKKGRNNSILEGLKRERKRKTSFLKKFPPYGNLMPKEDEKGQKSSDNNNKKSSEREAKSGMYSLPELEAQTPGPTEVESLSFHDNGHGERNWRPYEDNIPSIVENPSYYLPKTEIKTPRLKEKKLSTLVLGLKDEQDTAPHGHANPLKQVVQNRNGKPSQRAKKEEEYSEKAISEKLAAIKQKSRARKVQKLTQRAATLKRNTNLYQTQATKQTAKRQQLQATNGTKQKREILDIAVEHWAKQTIQRRKLSIFTSRIDGDFATTIQSAWRSHRDQICLAFSMLQSWDISCDFSPDTMNNDRILRQTANVLALDGAFSQVGYHWQNGDVLTQRGLVWVEWEGLVPIHFSEHGLPADDTCCRVSVHCTASDGPVLDSWSDAKRRILLTKAAIEKFCDDQRQKLRRSSMFEKIRKHPEDEQNQSNENTHARPQVPSQPLNGQSRNQSHGHSYYQPNTPVQHHRLDPRSPEDLPHPQTPKDSWSSESSHHETPRQRTYSFSQLNPEENSWSSWSSYRGTQSYSFNPQNRDSWSSGSSNHAPHIKLQQTNAPTQTQELNLRHKSANVIQNAYRRFRDRSQNKSDVVFLGVPTDFQERMRVYSAVLIQSWYRMCVCRSMYQGLRRIQSTVLLRIDREDVETIKFHRCFETRKCETIIEEGFECTTGSTES